MRFLHLLLKNLLRQKRRTFLTIFSIALSFFLFTTLASLPAAVDQILSASASSLRLVCHNKAGITYWLPTVYKRKIASHPHVVAVVGWLYFGGVYRGPSDRFDSFASDHQQFGEMFSDWRISGPVLDTFQRIKTSCLVSPDVMKRFGWQPGQRVTLRSTIKGVYPADLTLEVAGSLGEKAPPSLILLRRDYLEEAERRIGLNSYFWVRVDRPESIAFVANALDKGFANSDNETETETEQGYYSTLIHTYRNLFKLMEVLGVIMLAAISFVAANTAAMSARERRREIAVLRAIGFTSCKVLLLLLAESTLVGLAGGLLGCAAACAFVTFLPRLTAVSIAGMPARLISVSLLLSTVLGFMSAIFSALPASRRNIVDALRLVA